MAKQEKRVGRKRKRAVQNSQLPTTTTPHNDDLNTEDYDSDDFHRAIGNFSTRIAKMKKRHITCQAAYDKYKKKKNKSTSKQQNNGIRKRPGRPEKRANNLPDSSLDEKVKQKKQKKKYCFCFFFLIVSHLNFNNHLINTLILSIWSILKLHLPCRIFFCKKKLV